MRLNPTECTHARTRFPTYLCEGCDTTRDHLRGCASCRRAWNRYRWDIAATTLLYAELRAFLGASFTPYLDSSEVLAREWRARPPGADIADFFRHSTAYLYNLAIWQASGHRPDYCAAGIPLLHELGVRTVLDFGCGIGNDTLPLLDAGFQVTGCDYDSPSTAFLRHRSRHPITVVDPDHVRTLPPFDAVWIIDTLDHLPDIDAAIGPLMRTTQVLVCENLAVPRGVTGKGFHRQLTLAQFTELASRYGLRPAPLPADSPIMAWRR
ncbi:class I SAM-dependent methyltransferase [Spongiactinospora rosea]|uniref:class I SAM-dependent methyltransferase n=1 Tax=Spongiactinospora rosea TaxID=2248750 RepID=UPI00131501AC|nr:class I SAM-dependent methyltransferase [Spongiactinospora rosea]